MRHSSYKKVYFVDFDGTLALIQHDAAHLANLKANWKKHLFEKYRINTRFGLLHSLYILQSLKSNPIIKENYTYAMKLLYQYELHCKINIPIKNLLLLSKWTNYGTVYIYSNNSDSYIKSSLLRKLIKIKILGNKYGIKPRLKKGINIHRLAGKSLYYFGDTETDELSFQQLIKHISFHSNTYQSVTNANLTKP